MNTHGFDVEVKDRFQKITLIPLGDIHLGTRNCDEKKLAEIVKYIADTPNTYWLGMGDYCEMINMDDPRFDFNNLTPYFQANAGNLISKQIDRMQEILKPIAQKGIGLLSGNHEETIRLKHKRDVVACLSESLNLPDLGYTCFINLRFRLKGVKSDSCQSVIVFAAHGAGGGFTIGGKINKIQNLAKYFDADIYLMGHVHSKVAEDDERLFLINHRKTLRISAKKRLFGITGTFYKTYQEGMRSYAEKCLYPPTPTGVIKITIEPLRHVMMDGRKDIYPPAHLHISA